MSHAPAHTPGRGVVAAASAAALTVLVAVLVSLPTMATAIAGITFNCLD
jgi:hypothetical protein